MKLMPASKAASTHARPARGDAATDRSATNRGRSPRSAGRSTPSCGTLMERLFVVGTVAVGGRPYRDSRGESSGPSVRVHRMRHVVGPLARALPGLRRVRDDDGGGAPVARRTGPRAGAGARRCFASSTSSQRSPTRISTGVAGARPRARRRARARVARARRRRARRRQVDAAALGARRDLARRGARSSSRARSRSPR